MIVVVTHMAGLAEAQTQPLRVRHRHEQNGHHCHHRRYTPLGLAKRPSAFLDTHVDAPIAKPCHTAAMRWKNSGDTPPALRMHCMCIYTGDAPPVLHPQRTS